MNAPQLWFVAGTIVLMTAGAAHLVLTLIDTVRPRYFAPTDASAAPVMQATSIRLGQMLPRGGARPSLWRVWLGIHISHSLGIFTFGLLCLLIATHDFTLIERIDGIRALTIAFPAAYVLISLRFFFYGPTAITVVATSCFVAAAVLSA